jgi:hypothetical protein
LDLGVEELLRALGVESIHVWEGTYEGLEREQSAHDALIVTIA